MTEVSREVAVELQDLVDRCIEYLAENSSAVIEGEKQVADIINRFTGDQMALMTALEEHDTDLADRLKNKMYEFSILTRQPEAVRLRILEELPTDLLAMALKGADSAMRKSLLAILPRRMQQSMETEIAQLGKVSVRQVQEARAEIMDYVRELNESKVISLQLYQETTVE